jgi:hypothetical protein
MDGMVETATRCWIPCAGAARLLLLAVLLPRDGRAGRHADHLCLYVDARRRTGYAYS